MDVNKVISKEGLKWKCKEHPKFPGEIICLNGDAKHRVMCFRCQQINSIPASNLISMGCVLAANEHDILEAYPPLKDQELSDKLSHVILEQSLEEIELYFTKLREDFESEVKVAEQRAKKIFIKKEQARQQVLEGYKRVAQIEKLKQLIVSDKEGTEKELDGFIKDKWNKAEENRKIMLDLMNQYETGQRFSPDEPNRIAQKMIESLKNINFFEQSMPQQEVNLIKSTVGQSHDLAIKKIDNSIYQIKQEASYWGQVYLDPILNPSRKYIIKIELELKPGNNNNFFQFGIVKDEGKDTDFAWTQRMSYYDFSNSNGITKQIKGNVMQSGSKDTGKHSFEIRIHLDKKLLRVGCLPDYSSIAELDDCNKIDQKVNYRFFLAIGGSGDMIRINNMSVVDKFNEEM